MFAGRPDSKLAKKRLATLDRDGRAERQKGLRVALVGSPNSGKSTLFNALTGLRSKIANYPGVTVDRVEGEMRTKDRRITLIDLPGSYTLEPMSIDEEVAVKVLRGAYPGVDPVDGVVILADATSLRRSLVLVGEVLSLGLPTMLVLTMIDELKARKGSIDLTRLRRMLGIPVVGVVGNRGLGLDDVSFELERLETWTRNGVQIPEEVSERYAWADRILDECAQERPAVTTLTDRLDRVLLHPVAGVLIFFAVMFLFFQAIFAWATPLMDGLETGIAVLAVALRSIIPEGYVQSFLVDGIVKGVGSVLVFLPQIVLVLVMVNLLEAIGYMARAAFVIDRVMGWAGLEGRCFVALLSSYACAIPGILATRTVPDPKSRLATILVAPFMTCSARLPVYALLISAFIPSAHVLGIFNVQGLTLFGLYLLGSVSALVAAAVFKRGVLRGASLPFTMELPPYRRPMLRVIWQQTWRGTRVFLRKAGTIILTAAIVLWFLLTLPVSDVPAEIAADETAVKAYQLENSYAASIGKAIEPAIEPLGFDWKIGVGLVASLAAREVIVTTLGEIYAFAGGEDDLTGLADRMKAETTATGKPVYTLATVLALLVFFVYALQCLSTLAVMRRETNSWKWPAIAFLYMLAIAYAASFVTYRLAFVFLA